VIADADPPAATENTFVEGVPIFRFNVDDKLLSSIQNTLANVFASYSATGATSGNSVDAIYPFVIVGFPNESNGMITEKTTALDLIDEST
jgi:hypothetical protein